MHSKWDQYPNQYWKKWAYNQVYRYVKNSKQLLLCLLVL
jgi:hypothetical protein